VTVSGHDVASESHLVRKKLGYLPENNPLYTDMYVEEYLRYVAGIYRPRRQAGALVREIIGLTALGSERHKKIWTLSKGYRQRVGLAQAIVHDPEVLILDEPTSGLDPNQIVEIRELISRLGKEKTVILSTHIMQEVEAICQRVVIISKGRIVANDLAKNISSYSLSASRTLVVEFSKDPEGAFFGSLPGVEQVKNLKPGTWLLQTSGDQDVREGLFHLAVEKGLVILSLHQKEKKLEDVFRELTGSGSSPIN
jgi:ABC-2 type transport system ATP-binding protein